MAEANLSRFQRFFHSEVAGSIILMASTLAALVLANSGWSQEYFELAHSKIGVSWGTAQFSMSLEHWIADGLMVIFFFVVGLEIKRELIIGELSSLQKSILPVAAAMGGMLFPALFYTIFNAGSPAAGGWGIPMATDIAFALGILALFGSRAPTGLKIFLTALAIADDLGAVLVIALFYTDTIVFGGLIIAAVFMVLIALANKFGIRQGWIYLLLALGAWAGVLASGIHATVAGVLVAMLVPVKAAIDPKKFLTTARARLSELEAGKLTRESMVSDRKQMEALDDLHLAASDIRPAGLSLEHQLHPIQSFLILPLFALFKAGVPLSAESFSQIGSGIGLGVITGLFIGKPLGILLLCWLAIKFFKASLPEGTNWSQILGAGVLAGVGFTMSIFISDLAFSDAALIDQAKLAIITASLLSGIAGYLILHRQLR